MMVTAFALYGSGTWVRSEKDMNRLGTGERKVYRRVYGPVVEQGI
jgi:hypothetical protein